MQSNIYVRVAPLLKEIPSKYNAAKLASFLDKYKAGQIVYPGALHRELGIHIKDVYRILEAGVSVGALKQVIEIYCPNCQRFCGLRYETMLDIPDEVNCIHCDEEIKDTLRHAVVVYKVL